MLVAMTTLLPASLQSFPLLQSFRYLQSFPLIALRDETEKGGGRVC